MGYPSKEKVEQFIKENNQEALAKYYRFLPSPKNQEEVEIINLIHKEFKGFNSTLSKKIGWTNG